MSRLNPPAEHDETLRFDASKRYDIYCVEMGQRVVVYRNALMRRVTEIFRTSQFDGGTQFIALEQSNGQIVFVQRHTLIKFCEPGTQVLAEVVV